jgi:quercetin dioxygenase-like cupin family protein
MTLTVHEPALDAVTTVTTSADRRVALRRPHPTARPHATLDVATLADIAAGLALAEGLWRPHVRHDPLSRTAVRLVATEAYEVWLLGWTTGQQVELHDHGGANAAFTVVEGELEEITLDFAGTTRRRLATGATATVAAGVVHDVVNRAAVPATSIHVYSDPLRTMTFYDHDGIPTHTELVQEVPALVTSSPVVGRALHPAAGAR